MPFGKHHSILQASGHELDARASAVNCVMSYLGNRRYDSIQLFFVHKKKGVGVLRTFRFRRNRVQDVNSNE